MNSKWFVISAISSWLILNCHSEPDEEQYPWGCYGESVEGADVIEIGTGLQNTIDIVNSNCMLVDFSSETIDGTMVFIYSEPYEGQTAAGAAYERESGGYDDWYLPSRYELVEMYNTIGN